MDGTSLLERLPDNTELYAANDYWCLPPSIPCFIVINTGFLDGPGEHYIGFYIHADRSISAFDSFGLPPYKCQLDYWLRHNLGPICYSPQLLQNPLSQTCGYWQIAFARAISKGLTLEQFVSQFDPVDLDLNDIKVVHYGEM